ncbi:MAG TPA: hypothetical protein VFZ53_30155 [Polyangiaceae bacterium]
MVVGRAFKGLLNVGRKLRAAPLGRHALVLIVVLACAFGFRVRQIHALSPYVGHVDEATWTAIAMKMRSTGDLNPRRFNYPSLPVYLMAAGVSVGLVRAELEGEATGPQSFERRVGEYYQVPSAIEVPKYLFALFSVIGLGLTGIVAYLLTRRPALLWLAPLIASLSARYLLLSWRYMNVDILGATFVIAAIAYALWARTRHAAGGVLAHGARHAVVLGVLAGLAVGSKYILATVLVPSVLLFAFFERHFFRRAVIVGTVAVVTFFVTTPFALLEPQPFLEDILSEARHYSRGHFTSRHEAKGFSENTVEPGLPMLGTYVSSLAATFGWLPLVVALGGAVVLVRRDARAAAIVYAHPVIFIAYMSLQRVFFARNAIALHLFVAFSIAVALADLPPLLAQFLARRAPPRLTRWLAPASVASLGALVVLGIPWPAVAGAYSLDVEARSAATRWILANVPPGTTVFADRALELDPRPLEEAYDVRMTTTRRLRDLDDRPRRHVVVTPGKHARDYDQALGRTRRAARFVGPRQNVQILEPRATERTAKSKRSTTARERRERLLRREERRERRQRPKEG